MSLLKKETKFVWTSAHQEAFESSKKALIEYPVLTQPDLSKEFILITDASGYAIGSVLAQMVDGKEHPVAYYSRTLKGAERQYGITEKECLSVVASIKHFRVYLHGAKFKVITDHSALSWLINIKDPTGRLARWAIYLQPYQYEIIYRKGSHHSNADALSRPVLTITVVDEEDESELSTKALDVYEDDGLLYYLKHGKHEAGQAKKQVKRI